MRKRSVEERVKGELLVAAEHVRQAEVATNKAFKLLGSDTKVKIEAAPAARQFWLTISWDSETGLNTVEHHCRLCKSTPCEHTAKLAGWVAAGTPGSQMGDNVTLPCTYPIHRADFKDTRKVKCIEVFGEFSPDRWVILKAGVEIAVVYGDGTVALDPNYYPRYKAPTNYFKHRVYRCEKGGSHGVKRKPKGGA